MNVPPTQKKDKTKKNLQAIYLNSITASMSKNCKPYCKDFKKPRDDLAQRIAGEIAAQFIASHYMNYTSQTLDIETDNYIRPRHEIQWAARRLGLDLNHAVIPQIINSVRPGKHAPTENDKIVPPPKKETSRYIPSSDQMAEDSGSVKITTKREDKPNAFQSPSTSSKNAHHHHRHHSNRGVPHSPHSHHKRHRPLQIIDNHDYTTKKRGPRIDDPTMDIETTWAPEESRGSRKYRPEPDRSGSFVDRIGRLLKGDPEYVASSFGDGFVVPAPSQAEEPEPVERSVREFTPRERKPKAPNAAVIPMAAADLAPTLEPMGLVTKTPTATNTHTNTSTRDTEAEKTRSRTHSRTSTKTKTKTQTEDEKTKTETKMEEGKTETETETETKTEEEKTETETKTEEGKTETETETETKTEEEKTETETKTEEGKTETETKTEDEKSDNKSESEEYSSDYEEEEEEEEEEDYYSSSA